jgi:hypothetical protein
VFLPRLAQTRSQIDQAWGHDAALGVDHAAGLKVSGRLADRHNATGGDRHIGHLVIAAGGVDDTAVLNEELHGFSLSLVA